MDSVHYACSAKAGSEIYHYRLYSVPARRIQFNTMSSTAGHMRAHLDLLVQGHAEKPVEFSSLLIKEHGDRTFSIDGEMLQGSCTFQNLNFTLAADATFTDLITAIRDLNTEIWLEITVEQQATDIPQLRAGAFYWPRKTRSFFGASSIRKNVEHLLCARSARAPRRTTSQMAARIPAGSRWSSFTG
jgi:hypothetical protein